MYLEPTSGEAILPWVRLHATHAYYDMARMLERHPSIHATVNFVPCLVEQLERAAAGTLRERYLDASRRAPAEMSPEDRDFIVRHFFMIDRERCIQPVPRYWELFQKRGDDATRVDAESFTPAEILDLQVLFNLAWMGFSARAEEPAIAALLAKGREFSEADKTLLLDVQQKLVKRVLPLWKRLSDSGQVEISSTPYYHPILPLLCDSDTARRALPDATLPPRFSYPDDAHRQVRLAIQRHDSTFGAVPTGMWPAEGSVSPEALQVFASEGVRWLATDEGILFRSQPPPSSRGALYQPWSCDTAKGRVTLCFRDSALSDRIGFTYARMKADDAVSDFMVQVRHAETEAERSGIVNPVVSVILDGENAWEHYEGHGEPFLDALYRALEAEEGVKTATMREVTASATASLTRIHSGSWIDSSFRIWIGQAEDNLAWSLLGRVRALLATHEQRGDVSAGALEAARTLLLQAEGSDWFWWYGPEFETENAADFDQLFRDRLLRAAALLGETPPERLREPLSAQARRRSAALPWEAPTALITPLVDGRDASFLSWLGSGLFQAHGGHGSMYRGTRPFTELRFGADLERLYLRLDVQPPSEEGVRLQIRVSNGRDSVRQVTVPLRRGVLAIPLSGASGAWLEHVDIAIPLAALGLAPFDRAQISVALMRGDVELDRIPSAAALGLELPDRDFERRSWFI
jgi:alpha-amylase/alpha-mannosidase (GH57 family)